MKRDPSSGSTTMAAPSVSNFGIFTTRFTVTHNLGFLPMFRVEYEGFNDGVIWSPMGSRLAGNAVNPRNTGVTGPYLLAWPSTTQLTIELGYTTNTLGYTVPVYWVIYKDFIL
jgi:hypothetical protein